MRPSDVLFDATPLARAHAARGIGAAVRGTVSGLAEVLGPAERPVLLVTDRQEPVDGFRCVRVRWPAWRVERLPDLWPRLLIERAVRRRRPWLFHATQHELIPDGRRMPTVATCYDLVPLHDPGDRPRLSSLVRANLRRLRTVEMVACISRATADDVMATLGLPGERIAVIPLGIPAQPEPAGETPHRPYVLYANSFEPHKNPGLAIDALAASHADVDLVMVGVSSPMLTEDLLGHAEARGVAARVRVLGYVDAAFLAALRRDAVAVLVTSRREGFGLPVLEAMQAGTPVIAAGIPALREVAGDAAVVLSPDAPAEWGAAIDALAGEPGRARALVAKGRERAAAFSWSRTAEGLIRLWAGVDG